MHNASIFDSGKFAEIMKEEVENIATRKYGGNSKTQSAKAFAFWCIKNISPSIKDEKVIEIARSICETGGPGDQHIDGAWIDEANETLFLIQAKYSGPEFPRDDSDFAPPKFSSEAAEELDQGFSRLFNYYSTHELPGESTAKLLALESLYRKAMGEHIAVRLVVAISGDPKRALFEKI